MERLDRHLLLGLGGKSDSSLLIHHLVFRANDIRAVGPENLL